MKIGIGELDESFKSNLVLLYWLVTAPVLQEAQFELFSKQEHSTKNVYTALIPITSILNVF